MEPLYSLTEIETRWRYYQCRLDLIKTEEFSAAALERMIWSEQAIFAWELAKKNMSIEWVSINECIINNTIVLKF